MDQQDSMVIRQWFSPRLDEEGLKQFIDGMQERAELTRDSDKLNRWMLAVSDGISVETSNPNLFIGFDKETIENTLILTRQEAAFFMADELAAWLETHLYYLSGLDTPGRYFVDATCSDSRIAAVLARGGNIRNREQMLHDDEHPGLAQALSDWEAGDDSIVASKLKPWADWAMAFIARARATGEWGMWKPLLSTDPGVDTAPLALASDRYLGT